MKKIPTDASPSRHTAPPCWDDEEAREFLLRLLDRLGMSIEEALEGKSPCLYSTRISM